MRIVEPGSFEKNELVKEVECGVEEVEARRRELNDSTLMMKTMKKKYELSESTAGVSLYRF
jgi:hypothetical protein